MHLVVIPVAMLAAPLLTNRPVCAALTPMPHSKRTHCVTHCVTQVYMCYRKHTC